MVAIGCLALLKTLLWQLRLQLPQCVCKNSLVYGLTPFSTIHPVRLEKADCSMTTIKFKPGDPETVVKSGLEHVYAVDALLISYPAKAVFDGEVITVSTATDQSCRIFFPWPVSTARCEPNSQSLADARCGALMLSTSSLPAREEPYLYELEVARGAVGTLVEKFATLRESGTQFSENACEAMRLCKTSLANAIYTNDRQEAAEQSDKAIRLCLSTLDLVLQEHAPVARKQSARFSVGVNVGQRFMRELLADQDATDAARVEAAAADTVTADTVAAEIPETAESPCANGDSQQAAAREFVCQFDNVILKLPGQSDQPMSADIAFINRSKNGLRNTWAACRDEKIQRLPNRSTALGKVGVGPVLDWRTVSVDEWFESETDLESIRQDLFNWGEMFGRQLSLDVGPLHVAAGIGSRTTSRFNDQNRLQLTLDTMCGIHQGKADLKQMVSFYQPLGSEIDPEAMAVSPLHAADALLRTDVGLQRIGIEIAFTTDELPSNRSLLHLDVMIDAWEQFELPLSILINFPDDYFPNPNLKNSGALLDRLHRETENVFALAGKQVDR